MDIFLINILAIISIAIKVIAIIIFLLVVYFVGTAIIYSKKADKKK